MEKQTIKLGEQNKAKGEGAIKLLGKALDVAGDIIAKTKDASSSQEISDRAREVFVAAVKKESEKSVEGLADAIPLGNALLLTARLSYAFAQGVGAGMNEEIARQKREDKANTFSDDDDQVAVTACVRLAQLHAVLALPGIVSKGVEFAGAAAIKMIEDTGIKAGGKMIGSIFKQISDQLFQQNEVLAITKELIRSKADAIPEARRKAYGMLFSFAAGTFVEQFGRPGLAKQLAEVTNSSKEEPDIEVALLSGVMKTYADKIAEAYAKEIQFEEGEQELKSLLSEMARRTLDGLVAGGLTIEKVSGNEVSREGDVVKVPAELCGAQTPQAAQQDWDTVGKPAWQSYMETARAKLRSIGEHRQWWISWAHLNFDAQNQAYLGEVAAARADATARADSIVTLYGLDSETQLTSLDKLTVYGMRDEFLAFDGRMHGLTALTR